MKLHVLSASLWLFRAGLWVIIVYRHYRVLPKKFFIFYLNSALIQKMNISLNIKEWEHPISSKTKLIAQILT